MHSLLRYLPGSAFWETTLVGFSISARCCSMSLYITCVASSLIFPISKSEKKKKKKTRKISDRSCINITWPAGVHLRGPCVVLRPSGRVTLLWCTMPYFHSVPPTASHTSYNRGFQKCFLMQTVHPHPPPAQPSPEAPPPPTLRSKLHICASTQREAPGSGHSPVTRFLNGLPSSSISVHISFFSPNVLCHCFSPAVSHTGHMGSNLHSHLPLPQSKLPPLTLSSMAPAHCKMRPRCQASPEVCSTDSAMW